jgi:predicted PurR-regulated permease PerM
VLWGVVAGLLNFMPYVGAVATVGIIALASVVSFDTLGQAMVPPLVFFGLNLLEGNLLTPMIVGNRLSLNTVALFVGMTFWWFVWGIPGALMAVPMMATIKIFCDHFEPLKPVGEFLGR